MNQIKWSDSLKKRTDPAYSNYDWCGTYEGKYVDLTLSYNGTWSYWVDGKRIQDGFPSREMALQKLTEFLVDK